MHAVSARSYSRNSGRTSEESVTGNPGYSRSRIAPICCSCAPLTYELIKATVSDSTPDATSSRTIDSTCCSSTGTTVSPWASMRSTASRVSASDAGGSGLIMMIQPASGPGVCERARCRICLKPRVVISPTRAPFDSSTAFVATVVPCRMLRSSDTWIPAWSQMRAMPLSTPSDGSAGVEGVFTRYCALPLSSLTRKRSVNVPPTSTPSLYAILLLLFSVLRGHRREGAGPVDLTFELPAENALEPFGDADQPAEVDARLDPLAVQQVDEVLRRDVAGRPRGERAAADSAHGRVEQARARLDRSVGVREAGIARVVQVHANGRPERADRGHEAADSPRRGDPDRVREHDLVGAESGDLLGQPQDVLRRDGSLERTAERDADRHGGADPVLVRPRDDASGRRDRLRHRRPLVSLVERLRGRE